MTSTVKEAGAARAFLSGARSAAAALSLLSLALVGFVALAHLGDRFNQGHGHGTRMALARYANEGILFPPLERTGNYGGTRYMPLPVLVDAGAARITGEYLRSGKGVALLSSAVLLALMLRLARREGAPWWFALAGGAAAFTSAVAFEATTSVTFDLLPVILQLAALSLIDGSALRRPALAGILCGLGPIAKLNALWGAGAILTVLLVSKAGLRRFAIAFMCTLGGGLLMMQIASAGRMSSQLRFLAFSGLSGSRSFAAAPGFVLSYLEFFGGAIVFLIPPLAVSIFLQWKARKVSPFTIAFGYAALLLVIVEADFGAVQNHLIDVIVLMPLATAPLFRLLAGSSDVQAERIRTSTALLLTFGIAGSWGTLIAPASVQAVQALGSGSRFDYQIPADDLVDRDQSVLSEDAGIPVALGKDPVVLDPYVVFRIARSRPSLLTPLLRDIDRARFDRVILIKPVESLWYRTVHLGGLVADELESNYTLQRREGGYYIYAPR